MTIFKPIRISLLPLSTSPLCSYTTALLSLPGLPFSACLTSTEQGTMVTEHKGRSTHTLG
jgi:hypothetical protein